MIEPYLEELPILIENTKVDGVRRCSLKIYSDYLNEKKYKNIDKLLDLSFTLLLDYKQAVAIRVYCFEIILFISRFG